MRFTEREMTVAVEAVAKHLFVATRPPWRRKGVDAAWEALSKQQAYTRKSAAGELVLPVLQALPERPTVGASPEFSQSEYAAAAEEATRALMEHRSPGAWEKMPKGRRSRRIAMIVALTRMAVAAMPVRQDPDAIVVPDHL